MRTILQLSAVVAGVFIGYAGLAVLEGCAQYGLTIKTLACMAGPL